MYSSRKEKGEWDNEEKEKNYYHTLCDNDANAWAYSNGFGIRGESCL